MSDHHLGVGRDDVEQRENRLVHLQVQPGVPLREAGTQAGDLFRRSVVKILTAASLPPLPLIREFSTPEVQDLHKNALAWKILTQTVN